MPTAKGTRAMEDYLALNQGDMDAPNPFMTDGEGNRYVRGHLEFDSPQRKMRIMHPNNGSTMFEQGLPANLNYEHNTFCIRDFLFALRVKFD